MGYNEKSLSSLIKSTKKKKKEVADAELPKKEVVFEVKSVRLTAKRLMESSRHKPLIKRYVQLYQDYYGQEVSEDNLFKKIEPCHGLTQSFSKLQSLNKDIINLLHKDKAKAKDFLKYFTRFKEILKSDNKDKAELKELYVLLVGSPSASDINLQKMITNINLKKRSLDLEIEDISYG